MALDMNTVRLVILSISVMMMLFTLFFDPVEVYFKLIDQMEDGSLGQEILRSVSSILGMDYKNKGSKATCPMGYTADDNTQLPPNHPKMKRVPPPPPPPPPPPSNAPAATTIASNKAIKNESIKSVLQEAAKVAEAPMSVTSAAAASSGSRGKLLFGVLGVAMFGGMYIAGQYYSDMNPNKSNSLDNPKYPKNISARDFIKKEAQRDENAKKMLEQTVLTETKDEPLSSSSKIDASESKEGLSYIPSLFKPNKDEDLSNNLANTDFFKAAEDYRIDISRDGMKSTLQIMLNQCRFEEAKIRETAMMEGTKLDVDRIKELAKEKEEIKKHLKRLR